MYIDLSLNNVKPHIYGIQTHPLCGIYMVSLSSLFFNETSHDLVPAFLSLISQPHKYCASATSDTGTSCAVCSLVPQCHFSSYPTRKKKKIFFCLVFVKDTSETATGKPSWVFIKGCRSLFLSVPIVSGMASVAALILFSNWLPSCLSSLL